MQPLAEPVSNLIDAFSQLPGIGPKTATRLAYYLLRSDEAVAIKLARALEELKQRTVFCSVCFNIADQDPCAICDNQQRDHGLICVVEEPLDVQAIERTREFTGVYHVLHGAISPVEGVGPEDLKVGELLQRIQQSEAPVRELLLATNPNLEGEATAMYIARLTKPLGLRVTRLARGLPMGGDL
ncbi:MAG: recombination protein RecR, partial [Caldilineaceae bacterium]|nr:recombination protein RecR [Caldilineaceae bacterium]